MPQSPEFAVIRVDIPEMTSIQNLSINVDGVVKTYSASTSITDISVNRDIIAYARSANSFIVPLIALQSLARGANFGVLRVTGLHSQFDFDFWREAKARGLPVDVLKEFLFDVESRTRSTK